jgi:hypothetical protein
MDGVIPHKNLSVKKHTGVHHWRSHARSHLKEAHVQLMRDKHVSSRAQRSDLVMVTSHGVEHIFVFTIT